MTTEEVLEQVAAEVRVCTKCDLYKGTKHGVPGEGHPHAEVMFIGEAPGGREDALGRPFVGPAGQFLNELLAAAGLDRSTAFITNVVKHRPPDNRDPLPEEIKACSGYLDRQIAAINPKVIVTLGRYSMARFFPDAKISRIHGQAKVIGGRVVLAMYHPAAALHQMALKQTLIDDFTRAIPAALAEANRLATAGKLASQQPAQEQKSDDEDEAPPQQMSLF
ncbi:MAG TPA: uracil-DNA glycosylase [Ktedonobacterales bacterium]|nr:uracil-DNA glycosylase [Ktedonobacterales bacterium]